MTSSFYMSFNNSLRQSLVIVFLFCFSVVLKVHDVFPDIYMYIKNINLSIKQQEKSPLFGGLEIKLSSFERIGFFLSQSF